ncbi:MAG: hypothetical protein E7359_03770 [Clostridiales bacterium]|nr:hypothetical protein [Clostridiales bacterium]
MKKDPKEILVELQKAIDNLNERIEYRKNYEQLSNIEATKENLKLDIRTKENEISKNKSNSIACVLLGGLFGAFMLAATIFLATDPVFLTLGIIVDSLIFGALGLGAVSSINTDKRLKKSIKTLKAELNEFEKNPHLIAYEKSEKLVELEEQKAKLEEIKNKYEDILKQVEEEKKVKKSKTTSKVKTEKLQKDDEEVLTK